MGVIVAVCAAATTTVSEAKTEIMCLRMKRMPAFTTHSEQMQLARCRTKRTSLYTSRGMSTTISTCPSMSSGVYATYGAAFERTPSNHRPTERSPRAQNPDGKSRDTRDVAVRLRHVEPARLPLWHAAPSLPQLPDSLHRLAKIQLHRPPDFLFGLAYEDGK